MIDCYPGKAKTNMSPERKIPVESQDTGSQNVPVSIVKQAGAKVREFFSVSDEVLNEAGVIRGDQARNAETVARGLDPDTAEHDLEKAPISPIEKERAASLVKNSGGDITRYTDNDKLL